MSKVERIEGLFKKVSAFPNFEELATIANDCISTVHNLERQLAEARKLLDDMSDEEIQQVKDYAQKLRDERKLKMKPCPFCGSDKIDYIESDGVTCRNCEVLMPEDDRLKGKERMIDCISEWNKRLYTADEKRKGE